MSLLIIKGQDNWLVVTATELATSESNDFTFKFRGDLEKKWREITLTDQSDYKNSYNLFKLEANTVKFPWKEGEYRVYDSNGVECEIGKVIAVPQEEAKQYASSYKNENNFLPS